MAVTHWSVHCSFITTPAASAAIGPSTLALRAARATRPSRRLRRIAAMAASAAAPRMPRRPLGQTGLEVSVLGFGASPLGGVFQVTSYCRMGSGSMFSDAHGPPLVQGEPPPLPAAPTNACSPCLQAIDEDEGVAAVKEAFDLGINFFDTSPYYGDTKSEAVRRQRGLLSGDARAAAAAPTAVDVQPFSQTATLSLASIT